MHKLFSQVLVHKNLSKAGDLFSLEDQFVVGDIPEVLESIQSIVSQPDFLTNHNDQSLVEICITRVTSAIRETGTIEVAAADMVALLETCLCYNLRPEANGLDPPHAKIASDVMSCIFLNYSKRNVMELALPVSVKFLHKGNKELSRNMSSYLSLAAIEHADLLARHLQPVIDSVISGNYSLARVLPTIYAVNRDPINRHAMTLVSILHNCENTEKLALLSLFGHIAKDNPALLEPSVPQLCESLTSQSTAASTLQVFYNVALARPQILSDHLKAFKATAESFPKTALASIQVMAAVAKARQDKSQETMDFVLSMLGRLEADKYTMVLKEIISLVTRYPSLLSASVINKVSALEDGASPATRSYIQELRNEYNLKAEREGGVTKTGGYITNGGGGGGGVTVVKVGTSSKSELAPVSSSKQTASSHHLYQQQPAPRVSSGSRSRLDGKASNTTPTPTSTTVTPTSSSAALAPLSTATSSSRQQQQPTSHRSMTKLNFVSSSSGQQGANAGTASSAGQGGSSSGAAFDSRMGLYKSMTRLNASQQNVARYSSSNQVHPPQVARSVTCITNSGGGGGSHYHQRGKVTVSMMQGQPGGNSPTKSMSSGSMSGVTAAMMDGREILTVNVDQINADLLRQASTVLSQHGGDINDLPPVAPLPTSSYTHIASIPISSHHHHGHGAGGSSNHNLGGLGGANSHYHHHHHHHGGPGSYYSGAAERPPASSAVAAANAPFSLPSQSSRRVPPYNSGPLPTLPSSQPPSLGIPLTAAPGPGAPPPSSVPPLSHNAPPPYNSAPPPPPQAQPSTVGGGNSAFSNTLPSPRRRANLDRIYSEEGVTPRDRDVPSADATGGFAPSGGGSASTGELDSPYPGVPGKKQNRISVFEPYPMRDTVQHFCEKHLDKIKSYMTSLQVKLPLPIKCTIEERKGRKHAKLHFACQGRQAEFCLYKSTFYTMKTRKPRPWIHLMFLALQARSGSAISTRESSVSALKHCWEILKCEAGISFVTLVTGAFPPAKDQDTLLHELRGHRFFDVFEYNGPRQHWGCFLCNHPDRAQDFLQETEPVIEGQLKEKKGGRWKLFKKWKSRYFTLSGAKLTYKETDGVSSMTQTLDVGSIRSVKVSKEGKRNIPKAFEIFTHDRTFVLKAKDGSNAQEWMQCLSVARAHSQARDSNLRKLAYAGSLGRLNHHGRTSLHSHSYSSHANSNMALRTAV